MAKAKKRTRKGSSGRARSTRKQASRAQDAIALLKADHRQVEEWFEQFESARSSDKKKALATNICKALTVHATIEEEIFYPAFLEATQEEDIHHEAEVEHDGAKKLIAEIEASGPEDDYYDARVSVLSEMIKHHVKEEEKRDGMFGKARSSKMDLVALGERLATRKSELMGGADEEESSPRVSRGGNAAQRGGAVARMTQRLRGI